MKSKKGVIEFYRKNKEWIKNVVSNAEYPRVLRAAAGAVIEVAIEEDRGGKKMMNSPPRPAADRQVSNGDTHRCNKNFSNGDFDWVSADLFYRHVLRHKKETEIRVFLTDPKRREDFREVCRRYGAYISERGVGSFFVHNSDEFLEVCGIFNDAANIYAGIFERDKREKGTRGGDVSFITHFLIEFDAHGEDGNVEDAKKLAHRAIKELEEKYGRLE